jgi:hypothetical protein
MSSSWNKPYTTRMSRGVRLQKSVETLLVGQVPQKPLAADRNDSLSWRSYWNIRKRNTNLLHFKRRWQFAG